MQKKQDTFNLFPNRVKQDEEIENGIAKCIIFILKIIKWSGILFASFLKCYKDGFLKLAKVAKKKEVSKSARFMKYSLLSLATVANLTTVLYSYFIFIEQKNPSNNLLILANPCCFCLLGLANKIEYYIEQRKITKLNKNLDEKFLAHKFYDGLKKIPLLVNTFLLDKYFQEYLFFSNISLASWKKNKDVIEEILNKRVLNIETIPNNLDMKKVIVALSPEPTYMPFSMEYIDNNPLKVWIGNSIYCEPLYYDFNISPHIIISGGTGKGKSVTALNFYTQLRLKKENRIILCDFKLNTFKILKKYNNNKSVITEKMKFYEMLKWVIKENERRTKLFSIDDEIEKITEWNNKYNEKLQNIFIFIDELSVITGEAKKDNIVEEIENMICSIAKLGRSQGIHLVVFTQKPSVKVVPSEARSNFDGAITGALRDKYASEMAIGNDEATKITNIVGRMLVKNGGEVTEYQATFIDKNKLSEYLSEVS